MGTNEIKLPGSGMRSFLAAICFLLTCLSQPASAQYATGGLGSYQEQIYWINWSGVNTIWNGRNIFRTLPSGALFHAEFSNVVKHNGDIEAYNTGSWMGDKLDNHYSGVNPIGLVNTVSGGDVSFTLHFSVTLNGDTVPYHLIMADAEDNNSNEYFEATTNGEDWQVLEIMPSPNGSRPLSDQNLDFSNGDKTIRQWYGPSANYIPGGIYVSQNATQLDVRIKGGGKSAIAIGSYLPFDFNDITGYGDATHLMEENYVNGYNPSPGVDATYTLEELDVASIEDVQLLIGSTIDAESDSMATPAADGDGADDDGTTFPVYDRSGNYSLDVAVVNTTGANAYLRGWVDFNDDSDFDESYEISQIAALPASGTATLNFSGIPTSLTVNEFTGARLRLAGDSTEVSMPTGLASMGEVEDYLLSEAVLLDLNVLEFGAEKKGDQAHLQWQVGEPDAWTTYIVEKSTDAFEWSEIHEVMIDQAYDGQGAFQLIDVDPGGGFIYYRIRQEDPDGKLWYSDVQAIEFPMQMSQLFDKDYRLFPNPVSEVLHIEGQEGIGCVRMMPMNGGVISQECFGGANKAEMPMQQQPKGIYLLTIENIAGKVVDSRRVVKAY